jgi:hypothetical protein
MSSVERPAQLGPVEITVDAALNVITVRFRGLVSPQDMKIAAEQASVPFGQLRRGFTLITDLTDLSTMDLECVPYLTRLMDLSLAAGVGGVARIIPDPDKDIGFGLLSLTHYRGRVPIATYDTREAANREMMSGR